jgi:hypothetical protein
MQSCKGDLGKFHLLLNRTTGSLRGVGPRSYRGLHNSYMEGKKRKEKGMKKQAVIHPGTFP